MSSRAARGVGAGAARMANFFHKALVNVRYKLMAVFMVIFMVAITIITTAVFSYVSHITKRNAGVANSNLLSHISDNIGFILNDVRDTSLFLLADHDLISLLQADDPNSYPMLRLQDEVYDAVVTRVVMGNNYIDAIEVLGLNGANISMNKYYGEVLYDDTQVEGAKNLLDNSDWTPDGQIGYFLNTGGRLTFLRVLRSSSNLSRPLGNLLIHLSTERIDDTYENRLLYPNSELYVVDSNNVIISSNLPDQVGTTLAVETTDAGLNDSANSYTEFKLNGKDRLMFSQTLDTYNWRVVNIVTEADILWQNSLIWRSLIITIMLSAVIGIIIVLVYTKKVLAPLSDVVLAMKEIERENYAVRIPEHGNDEIGNMAVSFNHMAARLDSLIKQVYAFQIKQRDAQITILKSQMNPHFLYNVLDVIVWKSRAENAYETAEIARELSLYLRKSISQNAVLLPLWKEWEHLEHYIRLQTIRLGDDVTFTQTIDPEVKDSYILGDSLQPLVENALNHGIVESGGVGSIHIRIFRRDETLIMEVEDDGCEEINLAEIAQLMQKEGENQRGFAIKNINDRLHLLFGENAGLYYERTADGLTIARIVQLYCTEPL